MQGITTDKFDFHTTTSEPNAPLVEPEDAGPWAFVSASLGEGPPPPDRSADFQLTTPRIVVLAVWARAVR
jgi:hypothetical protein